jgi:hypothetical protein
MVTFDERFDDLADRNPVTAAITTLRSSAYLRWRYTNYPLRQYVTIGLLTRDESRLLGYAILYARTPGKFSLADFHATAAGAAEDLMGGVVSWARQRHAACIEIEMSGQIELCRLLKYFGFSSRTETMELVAAVEPQSPLAISGTFPQWMYLSGDEDYN